MSETTVGSIIGTLRLNITDFEAGIAKAQAMADHLDGKNVDVQVKVDSGLAETKLAGVAASEDKVDRGNVKVARSGQDAGRGMGALAAAIITLGPTLVPLAAATVGLAVGFGAMGAAGILAVVGIAQEMKSGSTLGLAYTAMLGTLKGDLTTLGHTAATGVLQPFQVAVADLQTKMPALNSIIGEFSVITGKTAGLLMSGLVSAFIALKPLAEDAGVYVLTLSQRFAALMSGGGVTTFGDYVRSVFPQVMASVESIVTAAIRLVAALAPLGLGTLGILRTFTDLINALPVDVLAALAQTASSVYIGFKSFSLLSGGITAVSTALKTVGISAETAAAGVRTLTIAAGAVGVLITLATLAFSANAESQRQSTQSVNDYADALRTSNGVIDESIRQTAFKKLQDQGAIQAAKDLGLNLGLVTDAALGNSDALTKVNGVIKEARINNRDLYGATQTLTGALDINNQQVSSAVQKNKDLAEATATATASTSAASIAQQAEATAAGTTVGALAAATEGQKKTADASDTAAAKMYLENDAAGILKAGLDALNGKAMSAAQAQNSFDSSLVNMGDHVTKTGSKVHFTTTSINEMSSASVSLRGQLNSQVTNLQNVVEANGGLSESTGKARAQMVTMRDQIIKNAVAHGVDRAAVTAYVDGLLKIPKSVPPTKLDVDKSSPDLKIAALRRQIDAIQQGKVPGINANTAPGQAQIAALQRKIDALQGKNVFVNVHTTYTGVAPAQGHTGQGQSEGGVYGNALGSITRFASGGENHVAQIAPAGAMRLWAEPETGGEAYIPLAPSKRARSLAILDEVNKRFGQSGSTVDMSGVRADLAEQTTILRNLVGGFGAELDRQARTIQTMQRQNA